MAAVAALLIVTRLDPGGPAGRPAPPAEDPGRAIFLFDGEHLLDASAGARLILAGTREGGSDLDRFLDWAEPRFEGLRAGLQQISTLGALRCGGEGMSLLAEWRSGLLRVLIQEPHLETPFRGLDTLSELGRDQELEALRLLMEGLPHPVWSLDEAGRIAWANPAYVALLERRLGPEQAATLWPLPSLFNLPAPQGRVALAVPDQPPLWFECHAQLQGRGTTVYALPVQALVEAERALAALMQTFSRTFSDLPVGLALFDSGHRLHLFNPALTDLTGLPVGFLSPRPTLASFLDSLRQHGMIPEPQNYPAWRARLLALGGAGATAAVQDLEEIWSLASGLTYRVALRRQPEGSLVFLLQDISDEIASTRRMRQDLDLGQSVIDQSREAQAVFAASGQLVMANPAYGRLWGGDPIQDLRPVTLAALLSDWRRASSPTTFWGLVEAFVGRSAPQPSEGALVRLNDGRALNARVVSLVEGATLVGFQLEERTPMPEALSPPGSRRLV